MTTVTGLIHLALFDTDIIGEGETASADIAQNALDTFNQMLAMWQAENILIYAQQETSFTPTGALSYTVGTGATVNMARPKKIDAAFWRSGSLDYPITMLDTFEQYESIPQKTQAGEPQYAFYRPSYANGTLYLYPQPSSGTVYLVSQVTLPADTALADTLTLPPEYMLPLRMNLYLLLAGSYGAPIKPSLAAAAASTLKTLRRNNLRIQPLTVPTAAAHRSTIFAG